MKGFKIIFWVAFLLIFFKSALISLFDWTTEIRLDTCEEYAEEREDFVRHQRDWVDAKSNTGYCLTYDMTHQAAEEAHKKKTTLAIPDADTYHEFWGKIYDRLATEDQPQLQRVIDSLAWLSDSQSLDYTSFAHAVVKMVQDMPYQYILSGDCGREHQSHPCLGRQAFGITSPVEFLYSLKGDCDSRTVLIYTLLRRFDYDPIVLISKEYAHSMLALDIPATGDYLKLAGKKYYFWETTATGWEPGMIPPGMDNKDYWHIALKHEL